MSELLHTHEQRNDIRWRLLATVSALALITGATACGTAEAMEADRPTVWIEVGGQLERVTAGQQPFAPDFTNQFQSDNLLSAASLERAPRYSNGFEGSIATDPADSDWAFRASVRYGRSNSTRSSHNQPTPSVLHESSVSRHSAFIVPLRAFPQLFGLPMLHFAETKGIFCWISRQGATWVLEVQENRLASMPAYGSPNSLRRPM